MIKALLLDFGSVISTSLFERHRLIEEMLNIPKGTLTWQGTFNPESDELWMSMLRDEITERDYWNKRSKEIGTLAGYKNWKVVDMLKAICPKDTTKILRPKALEIMDTTKAAGLKIGILTNEVELFNGKEWVDSLPFRHDMDCWVDATHTKILKPDKRSYQFAIDALYLQPHEILFVDDQIRNIAGAVKVGLRTLHFDITQPEACFNYMEEVLNLKKKVDY